MTGFWQGFEKQAFLKKIIESYKAKSANPAFRAMRAASTATLATGGAVYGLNRLAQHDVQQMTGQVPQPGQGLTM